MHGSVGDGQTEGSDEGQADCGQQDLREKQQKENGWCAERQTDNGQRAQPDKRIQRRAGQTDTGPEGRLEAGAYKRGDREKEVDVGRGHIATHGSEPDIRDGLEGACRGDRCGDAAQAGALRQAWAHSPALIPAGSWVAAEAAGGSPWGLEGGPGAVDPSPRARQVVRGGAGSEGRGREKKLKSEPHLLSYSGQLLTPGHPGQIQPPPPTSGPPPPVETTIPGRPWARTAATL